MAFAVQVQYDMYKEVPDEESDTDARFGNDFDARAPFRSKRREQELRRAGGNRPNVGIGETGRASGRAGSRSGLPDQHGGRPPPDRAGRGHYPEGGGEAACSFARRPAQEPPAARPALDKRDA